MGVVIGLLVLATYLIGIVVTAVPATRFVLRAHEYCHQEPKTGGAYKWGRSNCAHYDRPGCWRADTEVTPTSAAWGSLGALLWPLVLLPAFAYWGAKSSTRPVVDYRRIAEMERELGIGDHS